MTDQEFERIFKLLEEQGWKPKLCDTPVPIYENTVPCGPPNGVGDVVCDIALMPRELLPLKHVFGASVTGESMKDANIFPGDIVMIEAGAAISDGDIVLVYIDGECTLKTYCEDENGMPWLVPQNADFEAFPLKEDQTIYVVGKVRNIIRQAPRIKYNACQSFIKKAKAKRSESEEFSQVQISKAIREIAPLIDARRKWYAVYRTMVDLSIVKEDDFDSFIEMVKIEVPSHQCLPTRAEMLRIAIQSFTKPVALWRVGNAPVKGKRYNEYLRIAQRTAEILQE